MQRRASHQELQEIADFRALELEVVLESIHEAIYIGNEQGIVRCNRRTLELFGAESIEELRAPIFELAEKMDVRHAVTREPLKAEEIPFVRATLGERSVSEVVIRGIRDRHIRFLRVSCSPLLFRGQILGVVGFMLDVTDRRNELDLEKVARKASEDLAGTLQEERDLREQFVNTLTHDLRTPLTAAKMSAQLIQRKPENQELAQSLAGRVVESLGRAEKMIQDLLDANLVKAGRRLPLELETCELVGVVQDVLDDLASVHGDRFVLVAPETIAGTWCSSQLRRAIENLVQNALKYGDPDTQIEVRLQLQATELWISVHNDGPAISSEELPMLFEPFRRLRTAIKSGKRGWGLGLSLVRGVTDAYGGTVSVRSVSGEGTTFTLKLPRLKPVNLKAG